MPEQTRQLAAIMFTDIVGYTALMGEDEDRAFEVLEQNRQLHIPLINTYNGRLLKEMGDGMLISFNTVSDAVYCAGAILDNAINKTDINLRIGIHLGEVVFKGDDVFGDGVNIASRLEAIAPAGGIFVSESVHKNILNKKGIRSAFVREENLKNVKESVKIFQLHVQPKESPWQEETVSEKPTPSITRESSKNARPIAVAGVILILVVVTYFLYNFLYQKDAEPQGSSAELEKSIAVLPFENMSNDPEQEFFSDGMMEEILTHLFKIGDLRVVSRTSAMGYKGTTKKVTEIGQELKVDHILEGSVRKYGEKVRITVQLIDAVHDRHLWAENFDRDLKDIFSIQSEVAQKIAQTLKAELTSQVMERLENIPTMNTEAYELYLKGQEKMGNAWENWAVEKAEEAINFYKESIELDPDFSTAYVGLGRCYWFLAHFSRDYDPTYWDESKKNFYKAIELDPYNGNAFAELGVVQHNWDWDSAAALKSFFKAIELNPADGQIRNHLINLYSRTGNCASLEKQGRILSAIQKNVYDPSMDYFLVSCQGSLEQFSILDPSYWKQILLFQGKYDEFINFITDNETRLSSNALWIGLLGEAYALSGDTAKAMQVIDELDSIAVNQRVSKCEFAMIYMALGQEEKAFEYLESALTDRDLFLHVISIFSVSMFKKKDDPRFINIMERSWIPQS